MGTRKYYGRIGYAETVETVPGVFRKQITEVPAYGDVKRNSRGLSEGDKVNSDITVSNSISIVADEYANNHFFAIQYLEWQGALWTVSDVLVEPPRLVLRLGGLYNGDTPEVARAPEESV